MNVQVLQNLLENEKEICTRKIVLDALPNLILEKTMKEGKVKFSLFKSTFSKGRIKLSPYGNVRTPYLINNSMLCQSIAVDLSSMLNLPLEQVDTVIKSIALEARECLKSNPLACYSINGLCRIYLDSGRIRISTKGKSNG